MLSRKEDKNLYITFLNFSTKDSVKSGTDLTHEFSASDEEQYNKTAAVTCDSITQDTNDIKPDVSQLRL